MFWLLSSVHVRLQSLSPPHLSAQLSSDVHWSPSAHIRVGRNKKFIHLDNNALPSIADADLHSHSPPQRPPHGNSGDNESLWYNDTETRGKPRIRSHVLGSQRRHSAYKGPINRVLKQPFLITDFGGRRKWVTRHNVSKVSEGKKAWDSTIKCDRQSRLHQRLAHLGCKPSARQDIQGANKWLRARSKDDADKD